MTDFDFYLAFLLPLLCGFHNCRMYPDLHRDFLGNLRILTISEDTLEAASLYRINPTDAVRLAVAVENALDGIITWEPAHFAQKLRDRIAIDTDHQAHVFVASSSDEETGESVEVRMFVSSVNAFLPRQASYRKSYSRHTENCLPHFTLRSIEVGSHFLHPAESCIELSVSLENREGEIKYHTAVGVGLIHTLFSAIDSCIAQFISFTNFGIVYYCGPTSGQIDGLAQVQVLIDQDEKYFQGIGWGDDLLIASAKAYIDAINSILSEL